MAVKSVVNTEKLGVQHIGKNAGQSSHLGVVSVARYVQAVPTNGGLGRSFGGPYS